MLHCGLDVGSTTCKYVLCADGGALLDRAYERHDSKQAEKALALLEGLEAQHGLTPGRDRIACTGSGAALIADFIGARTFQEVVAVAAAVQRSHPTVRFVSEIGGEDMKTIFFQGRGRTRNKHVFMQSACSGGTGTFVEKTARKLGVVDHLPHMAYSGYSLHRISSKCGIFAEADSNTLVKAGVPVEEIVASLFEAVVYQNLAALTKGNTPMPDVLLLGGPNVFFTGLQQAWRTHLMQIWKQRNVPLPAGRDPNTLIVVPPDAVYYGAMGCVEISRTERINAGTYQGLSRLRWWTEQGQFEHKAKQGSRGLWATPAELESFRRQYSTLSQRGGTKTAPRASPASTHKGKRRGSIPVGKSTVPPNACVLGCDFGSTTVKAVCLSPDKDVLLTRYCLSKGNPIDDAQALLRQVREAGIGDALGIGTTGYGAEVLKDVLGADVSVVETVAHAAAALHFFPDADCICDVGGVDVKIMILKNGTVGDFRLNAQCSSGNGAFLQGVAERFNIPLTEIAERAFRAEAIPKLTMGCGVFLQSDIVNQQRKGWNANEILAGICAVLPHNVWIYAGGLNNLSAVGRKFVLQGGTHKNLAVVKAQVDFLRARIPDAEIAVHPYSGEAGAIGAALCALDKYAKHGAKTHFRGFDAVEKLTYRSTTSPETICTWCPVNCQRTFVDVEIFEGPGRAWSKVPVPKGWTRVITNNNCPKGLIEDAGELQVIKAQMDRTRDAFPNIAEMVRRSAFRHAPPSVARSRG